MIYTASSGELPEADLPFTGYCQYCGIAGAHVELYRPESAPFIGGKITFRARAYYACRRDHFEAAVREEARAEIHEQYEAQVRALCLGGSDERRAEPAIVWTVTDRYCWRCGTHAEVFKATTRCSKCGELQRLYLRDNEVDSYG
jgi:hypothetical protein